MPRDRSITLISNLAARQDRVVARRDLLAAGITPGEIKSLRRRGFLWDVFPGTYLVGVPLLEQRPFLRACVLHAGPPAWPTHRTGLELRGLLLERKGKAVVTTRRRNVKSPVSTLMPLADGGPGTLVIHESTPPLGVPTEFVAGFETTLLPRTLVDAAGEGGQRLLAWAWKEADYRALLDPVAIRAELAAHPRAGAALVQERLREAYPLVTPGMKLRSRRGEHEFLGIVRELGLPVPRVNVAMRVGGVPYEADFLWDRIGLVVETDGPHHDSQEQRERDRIRDLDFFASGLDVVRLSTERMRTHRAWALDRTLAAYQRQARRAA